MSVIGSVTSSVQRKRVGQPALGEQRDLTAEAVLVALVHGGDGEVHRRPPARQRRAVGEHVPHLVDGARDAPHRAKSVVGRHAGNLLWTQPLTRRSRATGNYGINTDGFTRAALAANAREYGDEDSARALEAALADRLVEQHGARRYRGISVWGNLWLALARFGGEDAFRGLVCDGIPQRWRTGPILADAAYPDVLVARAVSDGNDLELILRPGNGKTRTTIAVERLRPGHTYDTRGATTPS